MSAKAARVLMAQVWRKPKSVLGLATGATPVGVYHELVEAYQKKQVDVKQVTTFNLDEYVGVAPKDPASYHTFMHKHLFGGVNIAKKNQHIPKGNAPDPEAEAQTYENKIKQSGGIDIQLLGIAPNGHVGFCEPGTPFSSRTHVAELTKETRKKNKKYFSKEVPTHAITMGLASIMDAKKLVLIASGKEKAQAIAKTLEGPVTTDIPASIIQWHPNVTVIVDEAAASQLTKEYASPFLFNEGEVSVLTQDDLPKKERILVIAPHPDDASISLGGIIAGLSKYNKVHIAIMTTGYRSMIRDASQKEVIATREQEARAESRVLNTTPHFIRAQFYDAKNQTQAIKKDTQTLLSLCNRVKPTLIFVPQKNDKHPTHKTSREVALQAIEQYQSKTKKTVSIWGYEGMWSLFAENEFNTIFAYDSGLMKKKKQAIATQKSQVSRTRFDIAAESLARLRATIVPEQALVGYGAQAPKLGKYFELFEQEQ